MRLVLRLLAAAGIFVAIQAAGFAFALVFLYPDIERLSTEAEKLERSYLMESHFAANRAAYRDQARELDRYVALVHAELPDRIDSDFSALKRAAAARALRVDVQPASAERGREFYAELAARLTVTGPFHRIGAFIGDLTRLPGVVQLHSFVIERAPERGAVTLTGTVHTFRYLSEAEVEARRKAAAGKKGT